MDAWILVLSNFCVAVVTAIVAIRKTTLYHQKRALSSNESGATQRWDSSYITHILESSGTPIDFSAVQSLLTKLDPTTDQSKLAKVARGLSWAAFRYGVLGLERDMRSMGEYDTRLEATAALFRGYPFLKALAFGADDRGQFVRVTLRNEVVTYYLDIRAEWRSNAVGSSVGVLVIERGAPQ